MLIVYEYYTFDKLTASRGELEVKQYLEANNIIYKQQYKFDDPKVKSYPYDFALFKTHNDSVPYAVIEYMGKMHYEQTKKTNTQLDKRQKVDKIKKDFILKNKIKYIEIKYNEKVEKVLDNYFKNLKDDDYITEAFNLRGTIGFLKKSLGINPQAAKENAKLAKEYIESVPEALNKKSYRYPYISDEMRNNMTLGELIKYRPGYGNTWADKLYRWKQALANLMFGASHGVEAASNAIGNAGKIVNTLADPTQAAMMHGIKSSGPADKIISTVV